MRIDKSISVCYSVVIKKALYIFTLILLIAGGLALKTYYFSEPIKEVVIATEEVKPIEPAKPVVSQDPYLLSILKEVAVGDVSMLNIKFDSFNDSRTLGMYGHVFDKTIFIKSGLSIDYEKEVIAHEFLHYVWREILSEEEKQLIITTSQPLINQDWYLSGYVEYRTGHDTYTIEEIFPIICTERPDQYISTMVETCNKYINRSKLTFLYN